MISLRFLSKFYGGLKSLSSGFYFNWGMNYARWGQPAKAMYYLNRAAKLNTTGSQIFYQRGAGPLFDMGPYYLTALVFLRGPARRVTSSARITHKRREIGSPRAVPP